MPIALVPDQRLLMTISVVAPFRQNSTAGSLAESRRLYLKSSSMIDFARFNAR
jgi:hypothetical protein